jgi:hypothetical protein
MTTPTFRYTPPSTSDELVLAWLHRARESQWAHYEMANMLARRSHLLGVPVIVITSFVGTSVFASIASQAISVEAKIIVGALSVIAAVLSSLQTFFKFSERAERHKSFAARFSSVRRELEVLHASKGGSERAEYVTVLREKLDRLAEEAPSIPNAVLEKVQSNLARREREQAPH